METVELLKQNLAIEPDLRNFMSFVLESVTTLGGNPFSSTIASLALMKKLRDAGAGSGQPLAVKLVLQSNKLLVHWSSDEGVPTHIAELTQTPPPQLVVQLMQHLQRSTEHEDPALLFQRNEEMT